MIIIIVVVAIAVVVNSSISSSSISSSSSSYSNASNGHVTCTVIWTRFPGERFISIDDRNTWTTHSIPVRDCILCFVLPTVNDGDHGPRSTKKNS